MAVAVTGIKKKNATIHDEGSAFRGTSHVRIPVASNKNVDATTQAAAHRSCPFSPASAKGSARETHRANITTISAQYLSPCWEMMQRATDIPNKPTVTATSNQKTIRMGPPLSSTPAARLGGQVLFIEINALDRLVTKTIAQEAATIY